MEQLENWDIIGWDLNWKNCLKTLFGRSFKNYMGHNQAILLLAICPTEKYIITQKYLYNNVHSGKIGSSLKENQNKYRQWNRQIICGIFK